MNCVIKAIKIIALFLSENPISYVHIKHKQCEKIMNEKESSLGVCDKQTFITNHNTLKNVADIDQLILGLTELQSH